MGKTMLGVFFGLMMIVAGASAALAHATEARLRGFAREFQNLSHGIALNTSARAAFLKHAFAAGRICRA